MPPLILGRYACGSSIGRGATAVVHRARDQRTGEDVAVKAIPVELGIADRVAVEARAVGRLDHPGIVGLRDAGADGDCLYLVTDLIEGLSLAQLLHPGPPGDRAAVRMIGEVLDALAHAHERGVIHRDVKPANILVDHDGRPHLSDFGVARIVDEASLTLTGSVVGTLSYMAPEQARGLPVSAAAAVYSACLILYDCLTGSNPQQGASPAETPRRAAHADLPALAEVRPGLPRELTRMVDRGLDHRPEWRPSAAELAECLRWVAAGDDAPAPVAGALRLARRWRHRVAPIGGALAGASLAAFAVQRADDPRWSGLGAVALAAFAGGMLGLWSRRAVALVALIGGALLVGTASPGLAVVLALAGWPLLAGGWARERVLLLPLLAPALFAVGFGPLYAVVAGLAPRWPSRLWAAVAGMSVTLAWQLSAGADGLLAGGGYLTGAFSELRDERSPLTAAGRLWEPIGAHPMVLAQFAVVAIAALCVPPLIRTRPGGGRIAGTALWLGGLGGGLAATAIDPPAALGATIPSAIVIGVWAVWPWRSGAGRVSPGSFATLRG